MYTSANQDLIVDFRVWIEHFDISLFKVKSHSELSAANTFDEMRIIIGIDLANKAGVAANTLPHDMVALLDRNFFHKQQVDLYKVLQYLAACNHARIALLKDADPLIANALAPSRVLWVTML